VERWYRGDKRERGTRKGIFFIFLTVRASSEVTTSLGARTRTGAGAGFGTRLIGKSKSRARLIEIEVSKRGEGEVKEDRCDDV